MSVEPEIDVVAINDIADPKALAYLLKYDTVMGRFPHPVSNNWRNAGRHGTGRH